MEPDTRHRNKTLFLTPAVEPHSNHALEIGAMGVDDHWFYEMQDEKFSMEQQNSTEHNEGCFGAVLGTSKPYSLLGENCAVELGEL